MLHPLLGQIVRSPALQDKVFQTELGIEYNPFLNDHRIYDTVVFPATGYVEMALAAARYIFEGRKYSLENVVIREPLTLPETGERTVQITVTSKDAEHAAFEIYSLNPDSDQGNDSWRIHAVGTIKLEAYGSEKLEGTTIDELKATCTT